MKEKYGKIVLGAAFIIAAILMFACSNGPTVKPTPPCCEIIPCEDVPLGTLIEIPVLDGEWGGVEGYCACTCCGVYIMDDPDIISEHLKTCCP